MRRPLIVAHRGASADAPENTLAAFTLAVAQGADVIELDVRRSGDGALVVVHDEVLHQAAQGSRAVAGLTLAELQALDLGGGARVPTLDEVCAWAAPQHIGLNIEIKVDGIAAEVAELVRRYSLTRRVVVSSFREGVLDALRTAAPEIARGVLTDVVVFRGENALDGGSPLPLLRRLGASAWHPASAQLHRPTQVKAVRQAGYRVYVWTIDDPRRARELLGWGVDGIVTNRPADLRALVDAYIARPERGLFTRR